jgi:peptidoglycan/xylan/chitin deacetylase (PgdA/CDA1 family)
MTSIPVQWPDGKKCAVCITFDCDADTLIHTMYPEDQHDHAGTISWLQYDRVAVPRIVDMYERLGIKQTFFVPAWCLERYPDTFRPVVEAGHEIGHHGYIHESPNLQPREGEEYWFRKATEIVEQFTGKAPAGYRAPWGHLSQRTLELVAEDGLIYDTSLLNDDNPYILQTTEGDIVELACDWATVEDWSQYTWMPTMGNLVSPRPPSTAADVYMADFEAAYELGGLFVGTFHPMVSGRRSRLRKLEEMLEEMLGRGDVWFATMEEIARHVLASAASGAEVRREQWPFYEQGPIPEVTQAYVGADLAIRKTA